MRNTAQILAAWRSVRKTIVLITQGQLLKDRNLDQVPDEFRETLAALQQANVTVYEFDPRGLETERKQTNFGLFADNLTGGRIITDTNAPGDFIPQVFRESSSYYLIGFQPTNVRRDGRFRRVEIQVDRPGVKVLARPGYYAPSDRSEKPAAPSTADRALSGGLPAGDLPMSLTVAPFATSARPGAAVAVVAGLDALAALPPGSAVELVATAFDETWKQAGQTTAQFLLPARWPNGASLTEVGARLNLRPGRYEIRVAMSSAAIARAGSVYASVTIPDFDRVPISLSGVVIEQAPGGAVMPETLTSLLPARPTTARVFSRADSVSAVARIRHGRSTKPVPVGVTARIVDARGRVVFATTADVEGSRFGARREWDYRLDLPLQQLAEGLHLLTIEAAMKDSRARRDVRFTVRGH
jgi:hypothetical protein